MASNEKQTWIAQLWLSSLALAMMLGARIGYGDQFTGDGALLLIVAIVWFGIVFIIWLFRVTYLAGRRTGS